MYFDETMHTLHSYPMSTNSLVTSVIKFDKNSSFTLSKEVDMYGENHLPNDDIDNELGQLQFNGLLVFCSKLHRLLFDLLFLTLDCELDDGTSLHRWDHCSIFSTSLFLSSSFSGNLLHKFSTQL